MTTTPAPAAPLSEDSWNAAMALIFPFFSSRYLGLFSQRQPVASTASKALLRRLLAEKAEAHPSEVGQVRALFNEMRRTDEEPIWQMHVSGAIEYLKAL